MCQVRVQSLQANSAGQCFFDLGLRADSSDEVGVEQCTRSLPDLQQLDDPYVPHLAAAGSQQGLILPLGRDQSLRGVLVNLAALLERMQYLRQLQGDSHGLEVGTQVVGNQHAGFGPARVMERNGSDQRALDS